MQEKHAYHDPQICLRNSVPCFAGSLRCVLILMLPTLEIATWRPCTWKAVGVNTRLLKRLRPLNLGNPGVSLFLTRRKKVLKGAVETNQYGLQGMRVNTLELRAHFLDGGQLGLLL